MSEEQMRSFIFLAEGLDFDGPVEQPVVEPVVEESVSLNEAMIYDLEDTVFRLRGFMESEGGDFALGVETGMARAADMIENVIRRYSQGEE
jgi:hypothetical protein